LITLRYRGDLFPDTFIIEGAVVGPDYVFSRAPRLKGTPYQRAKEYIIRRSKGVIVCDIGPERVIGEWEVHHRGPKDLHQAKMLGPTFTHHNAGGHESARSGSDIV
jgi:hypothetical protein